MSVVPSGTVWQPKRDFGVMPGAMSSSSSSASVASLHDSSPCFTITWQVEQAQTPPHAWSSPALMPSEISLIQKMEETVDRSLAARRFAMDLLGIFAALALVLACVGIYGVISYLAGQRTHEIGIRMALGAQRGNVLRMVVGEGARMALIGVALGTAAALGLTRLMANQLFGVSPHDPLTFASVALLLAIVTLVACYLPARRAMRIDPMAALRQE